MIESHNGWLLQRALRALKQENVVVLNANYTATGVEAELFYPHDQKSYRLTLEEDRRSKGDSHVAL